ncbi:MAG: cytidylate kinase-like family protein [Firmicutes bacterium]|nr:cytidylate kinase-like family protein [Bacillota bacterium]
MSKHIITISRSYGSGGRQIAKALSREMGIHYYDKELMTMVSMEHGINMSIVNNADEKHEESRFKKYSSQEIESPSSKKYLSKDNIFNMTAGIIKDIAEKEESCVIVGRCAHFVLKDHPDVVRIFIHADYDDLIENAIKYDGCDREEAIRRIEKINKERAAYHRYYTDHEWNDARCYDLCLNTSKIPIEKCVTAIREFLDLIDSLK